MAASVPSSSHGESLANEHQLPPITSIAPTISKKRRERSSSPTASAAAPFPPVFSQTQLLAPPQPTSLYPSVLWKPDSLNRELTIHGNLGDKELQIGGTVLRWISGDPGIPCHRLVYVPIFYVAVMATTARGHRWERSGPRTAMLQPDTTAGLLLNRLIDDLVSTAKKLARHLLQNIPETYSFEHYGLRLVDLLYTDIYVRGHPGVKRDIYGLLVWMNGDETEGKFVIKVEFPGDASHPVGAYILVISHKLLVRGDVTLERKATNHVATVSPNVQE